MVLLSMASVTCGQPWSENIKFPQPPTSAAPDIQPLTSSRLDNSGPPESDDPPLTLPKGQ